MSRSMLVELFFKTHEVFFFFFGNQINIGVFSVSLNKCYLGIYPDILVEGLDPSPNARRNLILNI